MNIKREFAVRARSLIAISAVASLVAACGGGGGGAANSNTLTGVASKGPLNGATICAYAITNGVQAAKIGNCVTTDSKGNYSINLGDYAGPVLAQATGGTYLDEATNAVVPLASSLNSVHTNVIAGTNRLAITALSELAYQNASGLVGGLTPGNIQSAITTVQNNFGVPDIVSTMPVDALNVPASATAAQKNYALALATVSQFQNSQPAGTSLASTLNTIQTCLSAPSTGCGAGANNVGKQLNISMFTFIASKPAFSGVTLPVASLGSMTTSPAANGTTPANTVVFSTLNTVPTGACSNGGITVQSGIDTNTNGVLDPSEATNTQYICNGTNGTNGVAGTSGANGVTALVSVTAEPTGTNCPTGGQKVSAGLDTNRNGTLDSSEITSSTYICNGAVGATGATGATGSTGSTGATGATGTTGTNGTNGLNTLVAIVAESAGQNCTSGGTKITSGLDGNTNGTLDSSEVTSTTYVCNGAPGTNGTNGTNGAAGPAGPGITWVDVTATTQQAASNIGYMADNASQVVITLPASPVVGDIVQVNGVGAGGWKIATNAGQSIVTSYISATPLAGTISGLQYEAIALQYVGNSTFTVLNYVGTNPTALVTAFGYVSQGGLTWMRVSATTYTYAAAGTLCAGTINAQTGWRLPTQAELNSLYASGAMNGQGWSLGYTWSSTPYGSAGYYVVDLAFGAGYPFASSANFLASCVR